MMMLCGLIVKKDTGMSNFMYTKIIIGLSLVKNTGVGP